MPTEMSANEHDRIKDLRMRIRDAFHGKGITQAQALAMMMEMVETLAWLVEAQDQTDEAMGKFLSRAMPVPKDVFDSMFGDKEGKGEESGETKGTKSTLGHYLSSGQYL